ncbi:polynucleotide adenylyltransferase family protein [Actinidia rufa]|uniref:Polynucleotide adenylyltransferase family protein n=1 Tax=Actinidia rufa TaxID=165716 RepID=A0A7J0EMW5_9ERIC|nr:polynucleotide adenylyltransferase family protein [Actinidia rufa]
MLSYAGFEAYLVGGCVRDLLLNKVPKDFDVITTAALEQVSSFETLAKSAKVKEGLLLSQMPRGCNRIDFVRWRDCMRRDFTVNSSLFFDPFVNKIYDYADGMMDLRSLKLQTLIPAQLSFEEDSARILRAFRIAARLGLSFSKETETAIRKLSLSITSLAKSRLMLELNYMLSYGAASPLSVYFGGSTCLTFCYHFRSPWITGNIPCSTSPRTVLSSKFPDVDERLFSNLDKLVTCDKPSDCSLWVTLLAVHMALVNNPQDTLVVWTFASVLYHGRWEEGVKFAREHAQSPTSFKPEIKEACDVMSDDQLAERVTDFAHSQIHHALVWYFIPHKTGRQSADLLSMLVNDVVSLKTNRTSFDIDYDNLRKGKGRETRFVLGRIIMDTMSNGVFQENKVVKEDKDYLHISDQHKVETLGEKCYIAASDIETRHIVSKVDDRKRSLSPSDAEVVQQGWAKKQKLTWKDCSPSENKRCKKQKAVVYEKAKNEGKQKPEVAKRDLKLVKNEINFISQNDKTQQQQSNLPSKETVMTQANVSENGKGKHIESPEEFSDTQLKAVEKCRLPQDRSKQEEVVLENKKRLHQEQGITEKNDKHKQDLTKEKHSRPVLSSLFR